MKKNIIITGAIIVTILILLRISFVTARTSLNKEFVRNAVGEFHPHDAKLSVEPNTGHLCWTFIQASWTDANTVNVSLFGNPMSFGKIKWIDTPSHRMEIAP